MAVTTVRLRPEVQEGLENMADELQRSKSWLINAAVAEFIQRRRLEQLRWQETLAAMESVARGEVVSGDAVHAWLKSWGDSNEFPPPEVRE